MEDDYWKQDYSKQVVVWDDEMMKLVQEDEEPKKKNQRQACPICDVLFWKDGKALNRHVFKDHINELLDSFGSTPIHLFQVPYNLYVPDSTHTKKFNSAANLIDPTQNSLKVEGYETHGHGEDDRFLNPETGRMKLHQRKRPEKPMRFMYFCFLCEEVWTSQKVATRHFISDLGKRTACCGAKQHEKIQWFIDKRKGFIKNKLFISEMVTNQLIKNEPVNEIIVDDTYLVVTTENNEIEALRKENAIQKKKLIKFTTEAVARTREKEKLLAKLEKAEHYVELKEAKVKEMEIIKQRTKTNKCHNCLQEDLSIAMGTCSICNNKCHHKEKKYGCWLYHCALNECDKPICGRCRVDDGDPPFCNLTCKKTYNQNKDYVHPEAIKNVIQNQSSKSKSIVQQERCEHCDQYNESKIAECEVCHEMTCIDNELSDCYQYSCKKCNKTTCHKCLVGSKLSSYCSAYCKSSV